MSPQAHKLISLVVFAALCFYFTLPPTHPRLSLRFPKESYRPKARPPATTSVTARAKELPRVVDRPDVTISEYLDARFSNVPEGAEAMTTMPDGSQLGPHVWITMADKSWVLSGAYGMHKFVETLNDERAVKYGQIARRTVLVTLCLDRVCLAECGNLGMYCFGGHTWTKPPLVSAARLCVMYSDLRKLIIVVSDRRSCASS